MISLSHYSSDNLTIKHERKIDHSKQNKALEKAIRANDVGKSFGNTPVVNNLSFELYAGEFCALLGPNGAGKTTTLRMIAGVSPPTTGELVVLGHKIPASARAMRELVGIVSQEDVLDLDFSVIENLKLYGSYFGIKTKKLISRIDWLLEFCNLSDKANARVHQLSGGMRRRLSIAKSLINSPKLLILDEPTTGLDPHSRQAIWKQLRRLQHEGLTLLLTTHYMEEAERLCDRIILMNQGSILVDQSPESLIKNSIEPHVLEVFGGNFENWLARTTVPAGIRYEKTEDCLRFYGDNFSEMINSLDNSQGVRYICRPANLEDVFLKLTGSGLDD